MKGYFILLLCLLALFSGCAVTKAPVDDEKILMWNKDKPVAWTDFKGPIDPETKWGAVTISFIAYQVLDKKKVMVTACFNREESWKAYTRDDLLQHEQYHFNITEIFAREMRQIVSSKKIKPETNEFKILYSDKIKASGEMQKEYDEITQHGQNKDQQVLQEKIIDDKLKALDEFQQTTITY